MNKHTQGPWTIGKGKRIQAAVNAAGGCIVVVDENAIGVMANAQLIAKAPQMDNALRAIIARIHGEWDNPALVSLGPLGDNTLWDIERFALSALGSLGAQEDNPTLGLCARGTVPNRIA